MQSIGWRVMILLTCAFLILATLPLHKSGVAAFIGGAFILLVFAVIFQQRLGEEGRHSFEGTAALVSSLAILSTAYWFVFERPGVPKIDVACSAEMFPIAGKGVLVRIGVQAKNVGSTAVKFQKSAVAIISVGQVIPLPYKEFFLYRENIKTIRQSHRFADIEDADNWPILARRQVDIESIIESGETERFYCKTVVPCSKDMVISVTVRMPKPDSALDRLFGKSSETFYWIDQSTSRLDRPCVN